MSQSDPILSSGSIRQSSELLAFGIAQGKFILCESGFTPQNSHRSFRVQMKYNFDGPGYFRAYFGDSLLCQPRFPGWPDYPGQNGTPLPRQAQTIGDVVFLHVRRTADDGHADQVHDGLGHVEFLGQAIGAQDALAGHADLHAHIGHE